MEKKKSEGDILREWIRENRSSAYKLADRLGVSSTAIYHQLNLDILSNSFVIKLEKAGINIFSKQMPNAVPDTITKYQVSPLNINEANILNVSLVQEYAYAGYMSGYSDTHYIDDLPTIPFIVDKQYKGNYMAFQVRGDSMNDGSIDSYIQSDILLCREINSTYWKNKLHINKWDFVIVHKTDGILIKRITAHDTTNNIITIHSLNPLYDDAEIKLEDVAQLFNVVKVERKK